VRRHHISPSSIQKVVADAVRKAGIPKHATVHTLRHSFTTHLLMNGVNIRLISIELLKIPLSEIGLRQWGHPWYVDKQG
jgi:site-specific recombinase XerD